tara:strand:- start:267 stop:383 length:117 start_codon:yes stop_codon:yes gene_type:complete
MVVHQIQLVLVAVVDPVVQEVLVAVTLVVLVVPDLHMI